MWTELAQNNLKKEHAYATKGNHHHGKVVADKSNFRSSDMEGRMMNKSLKIVAKKIIEKLKYNKEQVDKCQGQVGQGQEEVDHNENEFYI